MCPGTLAVKCAARINVAEKADEATLGAIWRRERHISVAQEMSAVMHQVHY
jgi:hypothetical protein